jgi:hypothetical protein
MSKGIAIKSLIVLIVLALLYSVSWFFYAGQVEKKINNFVRENASNISVGEIAISGFPFSQTVSIADVTFTIPSPAFDKYQTTIKQIEAHSKVFSSNFTIEILDQIVIQEADEVNVGYVEFSRNPEITLSIADGIISKFSYADKGYSIVNEDKISVYLANSSIVSFKSTKTKKGHIQNKLDINISGLEGFDILSLYKNVMEKNILDGIKTGEIAINNITEEENEPDMTTPLASTDNEALDIDTQTEVTDNEEIPTAEIDDETNQDDTSFASLEDAILDDELVSDILEEENVITEDTSLKSDLSVNIEYELTPNYTDENSNSDSLQIHRVPTHYNKITHINNFRFNNQFYTILINGKTHSSDDDTMPSGAITVTVENMHHLSNHLEVGLTKISNAQISHEQSAEDRLPNLGQKLIETLEDTQIGEEEPPLTLQALVPELEDSEMLVDSQQEEQIEDSIAPEVARTPYQTFLDNITNNLLAISTEIAQKNQLTEGDSAVFDVRREKNIEILINETPMREILGKI